MKPALRFRLYRPFRFLPARYGALLMPAFLLLGSLSAFAQLPANMRYFTPLVGPAPDAAALAKEAAWPAGLQRGATDIDLPLGQVSGRQLGAPVWLRYRTNGIRVAEIAPAVGLGWSLHAGGAITRTVRGLPDETAMNGYFATRADLAGGSGDSATLAAWQPGSNKLLNDAAKGELDGDPDLFYFNFMGKEGRLVFDASGQAFTDPFSNYRITTDLASNPNGATWQVMADDGTLYVFGEAGNTDFTSANLALDNDPAVFGTTACTAWHLTRLISANREDTVYFEYETDNLTYKSRGPDAVFMPKGSAAYKPALSSTYYYTVAARRLRKIKAATGAAEFYPGPLRADLRGGHRIDSVAFFNAAGEKLNHFTLTYGYAKQTAGDTLSWRLRLDKLTERANACDTREPTEFTYYPTLLPSRLSAAQDSWGFYSTTVTPLGAGKAPGTLNALAGMLTKLSLPEGIDRELSYEVPVYTKLNGVAVHDSAYTYANVPKSILLAYNGIHPPKTLTGSQTFAIAYPQHVKIALRLYNAIDENAPEFAGAEVGVYVRTAAGDTVAAFTEAAIGSWPYPAPSTGYEKTDVWLPPGSYTLLLQVMYPGSLVRETEVTLTYRTRSFHSVLTVATGGGVRLSSQTETEPDGRVSMQAYSYRSGSGSSGAHSGELHYCPARPAYTCRETVGGVTGAYRAWVTESTLPETMQGGYAGYGGAQVCSRVLKGSLNKITDSTAYVYSVAPYDPGRQAFPFAGQTAATLRRGLLLEQRSYSASKALKQTQQFTYGFYPDRATMPGLRAGYAAWTDTHQHDTIAWQAYRLMAGRSYLADVNTTTYETAQLLNMQGLAEKHHYDYDPALLLLRREEHSQSDSSLAITEYRYTGDFTDVDPAAADAHLPEMVQERNMRALPVETTQKRRDGATETTLGSSLLTYTKTRAGQYLPQAAYRFSTAQPVTDFTPAVAEAAFNNGPKEFRYDARYKRQTRFEAYDRYGHLLRSRNKARQVSVTQWGYNGTLAVAGGAYQGTAAGLETEASGVSYAGFETAGTEDNGGWEIKDAAVSDKEAYTGRQSLATGSGNTGATLTAVPENQQGDYLLSGWFMTAGSGCTIGLTAEGDRDKWSLPGLDLPDTGGKWAYASQPIALKRLREENGLDDRETLRLTLRLDNQSGETLYADDLRLHPAKGSMQTTTYAPGIGAAAVADNNARPEYRTYDSFGRVRQLKDQYGNLRELYAYKPANTVQPAHRPDLSRHGGTLVQDMMTFKAPDLATGPCYPAGKRQYRWDFGDGYRQQTAGTDSVRHAYTQPGTYKVKVTVSSADYGTGTDTLTVHATLSALQANFTAGPTIVDPGTAVTYAVAASQGTTPYSYRWYRSSTFSGGLPTNWQPVGSDTTAASISRTETCKYALKCDIKDAQGRFATLSRIAENVAVQTPLLSYAIQGGQATVTLADAGDYPPGTTIQWFLNGAAAGSGGTLQFAKVNTSYMVKCRVSNGCGQVKEKSITVK